MHGASLQPTWAGQVLALICCGFSFLGLWMIDAPSGKVSPLWRETDESTLQGEYYSRGSGRGAQGVQDGSDVVFDGVLRDP